MLSRAVLLLARAPFAERVYSHDRLRPASCTGRQHSSAVSGQHGSAAAGQHGRSAARQRESTVARHRASTAAQKRGSVAAWQRGSRQHGMARWAHLTGAGGRAARQRSSGPAELCVILTLLPVSLRTGGSVFRCYWALCLSVCLCVGGLDRPRGFCRVCQGGPQSAIMAFLG